MINLKIKRKINITLIFFLILNIVPTVSIPVFSQNVRIKNDKIFIDKKPVLINTNSLDGLVYTYKNGSSKQLEIQFDYVVSYNKIFHSFRVLLSSPLTEIKFSSQKIKAKNSKKALIAIIVFLVNKGIISSNGDFNLNIKKLETFCKTNTTSFWTEKSIKYYEINNFKYKISNVYIYNGYRKSNKEVLRVSLLDKNERSIESVDLEKYSSSTEGEISNSLELINDEIFVTRQQILENGQIFYGLDKVFFDAKGKPITDRYNGGLMNKENLNYRSKLIGYKSNAKLAKEIPASYPSGNIALSKWVAKHFHPRDFESPIDNTVDKLKLRVKFDINIKGEVENILVSGTNSQNIKNKVIHKMLKMPNWTPAKENEIPIKTSFSLPINLYFDR